MSDVLTENVSKELLESIGNAMEYMAGIEGRNEEISENSKVLESTTDQLESCIEAIHQFVNNINNISNQTNMLSLNASIEAARSGAAGAGFAVVAKSMASLSADTKKAASQILELLNQLENGVGDMKKAISSAATAQEEQLNNTAKLSEEIKEIETRTKDIASTLQ